MGSMPPPPPPPPPPSMVSESVVVAVVEKGGFNPAERGGVTLDKARRLLSGPLGHLEVEGKPGEEDDIMEGEDEG